MIHNITYKAFCVTFPIDSYPSSWYFDFFTFEFEADKCVSFVRGTTVSQALKQRCMWLLLQYYYYIQLFPEGEVNSGSYTETRSVEVYI